MNKTIKYTIVGCAVIASILALPLLFKGVVISAGLIGLALLLAGIFLLGALATLVLLSPLWIPFVMGWAAVKFCRTYYKKETKI
jgi:hypothetical protein